MQKKPTIQSLNKKGSRTTIKRYQNTTGINFAQLYSSDEEFTHNAFFTDFPLADYGKTSVVCEGKSTRENNKPFIYYYYSPDLLK